jgi:hypothetical protein
MRLTKQAIQELEGIVTELARVEGFRGTSNNPSKFLGG